MNKIPASRLDPFLLKRCSLRGCNRRAVAGVGPNHATLMCEFHMNLSAIGLQALDKEQEKRKKEQEDQRFLEKVEPEEVLREIERVGFDNYDPETDRAKDQGVLMHEGKRRDSLSRSDARSSRDASTADGTSGLQPSPQRKEDDDRT